MMQSLRITYAVAMPPIIHTSAILPGCAIVKQSTWIQCHLLKLEDLLKHCQIALNNLNKYGENHVLNQ